jgi:hypothetical protein
LHGPLLDDVLVLAVVLAPVLAGVLVVPPELLLLLLPQPTTNTAVSIRATGVKRPFIC